MRRVFWGMVLVAAVFAGDVKAKISFITDYYDNPNLEFATNPDKGPVKDSYYCQKNGYKLMSCSHPYKANTLCPRDQSYADRCVCKPEFSQSCPEEDGFKGIGEECDGKYKNCCNNTCRNMYASKIPCEELGYEEIESDRENTGCGETCYVCSRMRI